MGTRGHIVMNEPIFVLIPTQMNKKRPFRVCHFEGWGITPEYVRCVDMGLMKDKRNIYTIAKHFGREYRFPACRAVFVFDKEKF